MEKEMQEFLDLCVEDGKGELKTFRDFLKILGLKYNGERQPDPEKKS